MCYRAWFVVCTGRNNLSEWRRVSLMVPVLSWNKATPRIANAAAQWRMMLNSRTKTLRRRVDFGGERLLHYSARALFLLTDRSKLDALQIRNMNAVFADTSGAGSNRVDDVAIVQVVVRINFYFLLLQLITSQCLQ